MPSRCFLLLMKIKSLFFHGWDLKQVFRNLFINFRNIYFKMITFLKEICFRFVHY